MIIKERKKALPFIIYLFLAAIGGYLALYAMKWGPWAFSDSSAYISAARNFASGNGLVIVRSTGEIKTITEFPPLYPILLSMFGGKNLDYINMIRWWNIVLFTISIITFSQILFTATHNHLLSSIGTMFFISFPQIVSTYTSAMSEPLFLFLLMISLFFVQLYTRKKNQIFLILFTIISSLLPITRYAGILFISVYGIGLLILFRDFSILKRIKVIITYYLFSFLPVGIWGYLLNRNFNKFGGKQFSFDISIIKQFVNSIFEEFKIIKLWIPYVEYFQNTFFEIVIIFSSIIFFIFLIYLTLQKLLEKNYLQQNNQRVLFVLSNLLIVGYILFIGLAHSITIPQIDIIDRMMIPIYPLFIFVLFLSIDILINNKKQKAYITILLISISFFILRFNILRSNLYIKNMNADGNGFTSRDYQQSGIIEAIKKLPSDQEMVSNSSGFILFYSNRYPMQNDNFPNRVFGSGESYGEKSFREKDTALIILFSDFSNYYNDPSKAFLNIITDTLKVEYIDNEGGIFFYPK